MVLKNLVLNSSSWFAEEKYFKFCQLLFAFSKQHDYSFAQPSTLLPENVLHKVEIKVALLSRKVENVVNIFSLFRYNLLLEKRQSV